MTILARIEPPDASSLTPALASGLAAVYQGLVFVYMGSGRFDDAVRVGRRAAELARAAGDEAQLAWALYRLNAAGGLHDDPAALETILAMAKRTGQTKIVVFAHNLLGERHQEAGEFALAMAHMEQSLAVAEQRQDPNLPRLATGSISPGSSIPAATGSVCARPLRARSRSCARRISTARHGTQWASLSGQACWPSWRGARRRAGGSSSR